MNISPKNNPNTLTPKHILVLKTTVVLRRV